MFWKAFLPTSGKMSQEGRTSTTLSMNTMPWRENEQHLENDSCMQAISSESIVHYSHRFKSMCDLNPSAELVGAQTLTLSLCMLHKWNPNAEPLRIHTLTLSLCMSHQCRAPDSSYLLVYSHCVRQRQVVVPVQVCNPVPV